AVDLISSGAVAHGKPTRGKAGGSALPAGLRERVQSNVLTHEQTMPVTTEFAALFPERALVRGRTLACAGPAATSTGMAVVAAAGAGRGGVAGGGGAPVG